MGFRSRRVRYCNVDLGDHSRSKEIKAGAEWVNERGVQNGKAPSNQANRVGAKKRVRYPIQDIKSAKLSRRLIAYLSLEQRRDLKTAEWCGTGKATTQYSKPYNKYESREMAERWLE